jgi:hypothetical protein
MIEQSIMISRTISQALKISIPRPFKCAWTLPQRNFLEAVNGFADTTTYSPTGRLGDIWDATEKEIRASFLAVGLD